MSVKRNGVAYASLIALAIVAASAQTAWANTISLVCRDRTPNPTMLYLNETKGTVTVHWSDWPNAPGGIDVYKAKFSDGEVTFESMRLNRMTGELLNTKTLWKWACQKGEKQF